MANATNGANIGFDSELWRDADAVRSNMDAADYKHVVLVRVLVEMLPHKRAASSADAAAQRLLFDL